MSTNSDVGEAAAPHLALRAARRRPQFLAAGFVLGLLLGLVPTFVLPHKYVATAKIVVNPVPSDSPDANRPRVNQNVTMGTEAQIARSSVVRELAAQKYLPKSIDPVVLGSGLTVSVVPDSSVLRIDFTAKKKAVAVAGAQAYALAYLENRQTTAQTFLDGAVRQLRAQVDETQKQIDQATKARDDASPGTSERQRQQVLLNSLNAKLLDTKNDLATRQSAQVQPGTEITKPTSAHRTGASLIVLVIAGGIIGLLAGLGMATLRERTDPRLREAGDIEEDLGLQLLAVLPAHDRDSIIDPDSAAADAYRQLRNEIFLGPRPPTVLAISRVDDADGTADVTANLAVLLSRSGRRVCVIDSDTGPRRLETLLQGVDRVGFGQPGPDGFEAGIAVVTQREGVGQGKFGDALASPLFARLVDAARHEADVVLIDSPPVLTSAGQAVLSTADAALLVVTRRLTHRQDVLSADERIRRSGARLVGTAVREVEPTAPAPHAPQTEQAALPPGSAPALPPGLDVSTGARVGAGAVYHPAPPQQEQRSPQPTTPPAATVGAPTEPATPPASMPTTVNGEPVPAPLGWPEPITEPEPVVGATGLGWPDSPRSLQP